MMPLVTPMARVLQVMDRVTLVMMLVSGRW